MLRLLFVLCPALNVFTQLGGCLENALLQYYRDRARPHSLAPPTPPSIRIRTGRFEQLSE